MPYRRATGTRPSHYAVRAQDLAADLLKFADEFWSNPNDPMCAEERNLREVAGGIRLAGEALLVLDKKLSADA